MVAERDRTFADIGYKGQPVFVLVGIAHRARNLGMGFTVHLFAERLQCRTVPFWLALSVTRCRILPICCHQGLRSKYPLHERGNLPCSQN